MAIPPGSLGVNDPAERLDKSSTSPINTNTNGAMNPKENSKTSTLRSGHAITVEPPKTSVDTSANSDATAVDFTGDLNTNNELPTQETLKSVADLPLIDKDGKTVAFKNIYSGTNSTRRVLVIFIRHFFCGNCQEFLRTLTDSITTDELLRLPTPTFIAVVGHGSHSLIPMYIEATHCPFPVYADPTKHLYDALGMVRTLNMGTRPEYQRRGTMKGMWESVVQGLSNLKGGKALQGLDWYQVGGEYLFEPIDIASPITSPGSEASKQLDGGAGGFVEEKRITWCHRMKNTRDHAELPELREVLGLDGDGQPGTSAKRWTIAKDIRKGTGLNARASSSTRNGGSSGRQSLSVDRESAMKTTNGDSENPTITESRRKAADALHGTA